MNEYESETSTHTAPSTVYISDAISRCEDIDELREEIFPMIRSQKEEWSAKITEIIEQSGCTKSKFAQNCQVSRVTVDKWCKGAIPRNRETFLKIGMAAGYDIDQMNRFLQRYGRYPALYSKSLEDCVCIYVLTHCKGEEILKEYRYIMDRIRASIVPGESAEAADISTEGFDRKLALVQNEDEMERFITENIAVFSFAYNKLYSYVKICIEMNAAENEAESVHDLSVIQGWSSSLRQTVSAIRQNRWYPTRNKIISLGLHLCMDHGQIDELLGYAHMEPLCAKNIFESVIIFILEDASVNNMLDRQDEGFDADDLCIYARDVLKEMDIPEFEPFIAELEGVYDE